MTLCLLNEMHYMYQCKEKISYLYSGVKPALRQIASLSHHPVTFVSTFPVSQLACQVSHDPLLLCCCFVLRESRTAGVRCSLMVFSYRGSMWREKKKEHKRVFIGRSPSGTVRSAEQSCPRLKCTFWCKLEEVQPSQRGWASSEHTEHIPEGSRALWF